MKDHVPSSLLSLLPLAIKPRQKIRRCPLCDHKFPVQRGVRHCPTSHCPSTPEMWVRPEDPLVSDAALLSWERMFRRIEKRRERTSLAA